jgi:hypothetical protein
MPDSQGALRNFVQRIRAAIVGSEETAHALRETRETVTTLSGDLAQDPARRDVGEPGAGSPPGEGAESSPNRGQG